MRFFRFDQALAQRLRFRNHLLIRKHSLFELGDALLECLPLLAMARFDGPDVRNVLLRSFQRANFFLSHFQLLLQLGDLGLQPGVSFLTVLAAP